MLRWFLTGRTTSFFKEFSLNVSVEMTLIRASFKPVGITSNTSICIFFLLVNAYRKVLLLLLLLQLP